MKSRISLFRSFLYLFFPNSCCGCGSHLAGEENLFCIYCLAEMPITRFEFYSSNPIERIFWGRTTIEAASAHLYFTGVSAIQHSIHLLKYQGRKEIGFYFGRKMGQALKQSGRFNHCEIIIPLPLYISRERKRGFNQSALIAEGISEILNIPVICDAVFRVKKTDTQTHKNRIGRWKNMASAFEIRDPRRISGKHILLVDDVVTTGSSLEACARVILDIPGIRVSIACLAHTVFA
jgi:ComF family protein